VEHRRPQVVRTATLQVFYEDYSFLTANLMAHTVQDSILLDNHANILLSLKNTRRIQKESSSDLEASSGQDQG
jgi:hypothetical protein